jgi:hypothetical protein
LRANLSLPPFVPVPQGVTDRNETKTVGPKSRTLQRLPGGAVAISAYLFRRAAFCQGDKWRPAERSTGNDQFHKRNGTAMHRHQLAAFTRHHAAPALRGRDVAFYLKRKTLELKTYNPYVPG